MVCKLEAHGLCASDLAMIFGHAPISPWIFCPNLSMGYILLKDPHHDKILNFGGILHAILKYLWLNNLQAMEVLEMEEAEKTSLSPSRYSGEQWSRALRRKGGSTPD